MSENAGQHDVILAEIRELRKELREFATMSIQSQNDIKWIKGSGTALLMATSGVIAAIMSFVLKFWIP
jgi:hypothetical protein